MQQKTRNFSAFWLISNVEKPRERGEGDRGEKKWRKIMLLYFSINATHLQLNIGRGRGRQKKGKRKREDEDSCIGPVFQN